MSQYACCPAVLSTSYSAGARHAASSSSIHPVRTMSCGRADMGSCTHGCAPTHSDAGARGLMWHSAGRARAR
eukprot:13947894-Alexandrium_andersonii.AAC.1